MSMPRASLEGEPWFVLRTIMEQMLRGCCILVARPGERSERTGPVYEERRR